METPPPLSWSDALGVELLVDPVRSDRARMQSRPDLGEADVILPSAERAGAMPRGERGRLVEKEELREAPRLEQRFPPPASELETTRDPALPGETSPDPTRLVVKAAAVAVDEAPRRVHDELTQRRHAVLQRHSDTVDGAGSCDHPPVSPADPRADLEQLLALNRDYIDSVQLGDVGRFDEILADDFVCSNPDGSIVDRSGFLEQTAIPVTVANLAAHDVDVRLLGDVAIIHARTTYTLPDGREGTGRYTDVWARRAGGWLAVAAHVTRGSGP